MRQSVERESPPAKHTSSNSVRHLRLAPAHGSKIHADATDFSHGPVRRENLTEIAGLPFHHDFGRIPVRPADAFRDAPGVPAVPVPYQREMERAFGADFSGVKAYLGRREPLDHINANAAASGNHVAFSEHHPAKRLVAHELAHVVQYWRAAGANTKSLLSQPGEHAEREASQLAGRVATGERVSVSAPPTAAINRDIKDAGLKVPLGHFEIDMTKAEVAGGLTGEGGLVKFKPNDKAPDSTSIRLSQAVKTFDVSAGKDVDYSKIGTGADANRNKMQTAAGTKTHVTVTDETLKAIAQTHYGDPSRFAEIFAANKPALAKTMTTADGGKKLPANVSLTIPKAVEGGFNIDHVPSDPRAKVRAAKTDKEVPQDYVWAGEEIAGQNQNGSKAGRAIVPASLSDSPKTNAHVKYTFETVARSEDVGIYYGAVHWSFDADGVAGKVTDESHSVSPGVSDTFRAALDEFNKFYKNPHTVMAGETLQSIAQKYYGDPTEWKLIFDANKDKINDADHISAGWKLNIPIIGP